MDVKLILQIIGILLGLLYLWFEYRADIRLWAVGVIMPMVHGALYYKAGLYADFTMQLYYVAAGVYGFAVWRAKGKQRSTSPLLIRHTPRRLWLSLVAAYAALHTVLYWLLAEFTDSSVPVWDSCTTALAVVAMWMLSRKLVEQWLLWLVVDVITVGLYIYKGIPLTAGLYGVYCVLAVVGYRKWRAEAAKSHVRSAEIK